MEGAGYMRLSKLPLKSVFEQCTVSSGSGYTHMYVACNASLTSAVCSPDAQQHEGRQLELKMAPTSAAIKYLNRKESLN